MVNRVIQIIEQLAQNARNPTLADLARSTGLPKSSLHRILSMLAAAGAVTRLGETYRLGDRLVDLMPLYGTGGRSRTPSVTPAQLDRAIAGIRATGLAVTGGGGETAVRTAAAVVIGRNGQPVAALTVCGSTSHTRFQQATHPLREIARAASVGIRVAASRPRPASVRSGAAVPSLATT